MTNETIKIYKKILSEPDQRFDLMETSDPIKAEARYLKYVRHSLEIEPAWLVIESNHPEVPNAYFSLHSPDKDLPMHRREKVAARAVAMWASPDVAINEYKTPWEAPTGHQLRALRDQIVTKKGEQLSLSQIGIKMGIRRRRFYNYFEDFSRSPAAYLIWREMQRLAGLSVYLTDASPISDTAIRESGYKK